MNILAQLPYKDETLSVEVLDAWHDETGRRFATVRTTDGSQAFCEWTHGGWSYSNSMVVRAEFLRDVALEAEELAGLVLESAEAAL